MPRVGGIFSLPAGSIVTTGQTILPSQHNPPLNDIAQALTDSLPRDGTAGMTGNLPMGANQITGLAAASAAAHAVRFDQVVPVTGGTFTGTVRVAAGSESDAGIGANADNGIYWTGGNGPSFTAAGTTIGQLRSGTALSQTYSIVTRQAGDARYMQQSWTLTAGDGLAGGGDGSANRSLAVDATVVRTTGAQSIGGAKTFSSSTTFDAAVAINPNTGSLTFNADTTGRNAITFQNGGTNRVVARIQADHTLDFVTSNGGTVAVGGSKVVTESRSVNAGAGLVNGGNLSADRTIAMGTPSNLTRTSTNSASGSTHTHAIAAADFRDMAATWLGHDQVGTFAFLRTGTSSGSVGPFGPGDTRAGSNLWYANASSDAGLGVGSVNSPRPTGTWSCRGFTAHHNDATVWQKISG